MILIRDMVMPKNCRECEIEQHGHWCGLQDNYAYTILFDSERREDCPLVELPPHGRLIDENDIMKSAEELRKSPWYNEEPYYAMRKDGLEMAIEMAVKGAPTIIEAEEAEGDA